MRRRLFVMVFAGLAVAALAAPARGQTPVQPLTDEQLIKQANLASDGPALLDFFRRRASPDADPDKVAALVQKLRDPKADAPDPAFAELVRLGTAAVPALRQAANDVEDLEVARNARRCLQVIEGQAGANLATAAARFLMLRKPAGAAEALLAYLPYADNDAVAAEVGRAVVALAQRDGKVEPAVLQALEDPVPVRRAAALDALAQVGKHEHRPALRKLLQDPKPSVRLRAAVGLSSLHEPEAIPVLIDLLAELPAVQRVEAQNQLARLAGEWAISVPQGNDEVSRRLRRDLWAAWWRGMDGAALVGELRKRVLPDAERDKVLGLIAQLGDPAPAARDRAAAALTALGNAAVPLLRQAASTGDPKVRTSAAKLLQGLDAESNAPLPSPVLRLVGLRKPDGAAEALLSYLPFAENERLAAEAQAALVAVAVRDGKADPVLLRALDDKSATRRLGAAEALVESGLEEHRPALRKLLQDPDPAVRLRLGLLLVAASDKEAVPVLIDTLAELPAWQAAAAEEFLLRLAGDQAPKVTLDGDQAARRKARDAWAAWWKEQGPKIDLAKLDNPRWLFGHTLLVEPYEPNRRLGRVLEIDARGRLCWQVDGIVGLTDAQVFPGGRVVVLENSGRLLTIRDLKGNVVWQQQRPVGVISLQRLANGNVFVVGRDKLVELDRDGKEVSSQPRPNNDVYSAWRFPDGGLALITTQQIYFRYDRDGKEVVRSARLLFNAYGAQILPDDRVLVVNNSVNKVQEMDLNSKVVWEVALNTPSFARRLTNGNTLVCTYNPQRVAEIDPSGQIVWEHQETYRPTRAHRR